MSDAEHQEQQGRHVAGPHEHSLTREEARARSALIAVQRYDVDVDLTGMGESAAGEPVWRSQSSVAFTCSRPGATTFVDCVGDVDEALLNGRAVPEGAVAEGRIRLDDLAEQNLLVVSMAQREVASGNGVQRTVDPADQKVYVSTSFEPDEARRVWACFDQPDLKAPHTFVVTAPQGWRVFSNSAVAARDEAADGTCRWTFEPTPPLSTYVTVVNAGPFHERRSTRGDHDLGLACRASLAPFLDRDAEELFTVTAAGLAFFGEQFEMPFAQRTYDQVFVPGLGGAMENWGSVTWGDDYLPRHQATVRERARRTEVLLHEMAHMWFGDLVTMRWWNDLWLNEAFASWASVWASTHVTEFTDAWSTFLASDKIGGYAADKTEATHPVAGETPDVAAAMATFDAITYLKGSSVLKQLASLAGEKTFAQALAAYFAEHAWGSTELSDLVNAVATASGRDLSGWSDAWLATTGADTLRLRSGSDGWELAVEPPSPGSGTRPHRFGIGVYRRNDDAYARVALLDVETPGSTDGHDVTALPELDDVALESDVLLVNDEDLTYAAARPDAATTAALRTGAGLLPTSMSRAVAVATLWDMVTEDELCAADFVRAAVDALRHEREPGVAENVLLLARNGAGLWAPAAERDALEAEVADVSVRMLADAGLRQAALISLAATASTEEHFAVLAEAARDDVHLGWHRLTRLAALGRWDGEEARRLLAADPDPDAGLREMTARAARPEPLAKEEAWEAVFRLRAFQGAKVFALAPAFWQAGQADLLAPYLDRYLDDVPRVAGGMLAVGAVVRGFFPYPVGDQRFVDGARRLAREQVDLRPRIRSTLLERADILERMLRSRGA